MMNILSASMAMLLQVGTLSPPPPVMKHDWAAGFPLEKAERISVLCRAGGRITVEFVQRRSIVSVVDIESMSHRLSSSERNAIDAAVRDLGSLDRVQIACNMADAIISVRGSYTQVSGKWRQRVVTFVWMPKGISGVGGNKLPVVELEPGSL